MSSDAAAGSGSPPTAEADGDTFSITAVIRAMAFYFVTFTLALPLSPSCSSCSPSPTSPTSTAVTPSAGSTTSGLASARGFSSVEVIGRENIPPVTTPAVYVANHASYPTSTPCSTSADPSSYLQGVQLHHSHHRLVHVHDWTHRVEENGPKESDKTLKDCRELLQKDCPCCSSPRARGGTAPW